jgi:hypothetical protein
MVAAFRRAVQRSNFSDSGSDLADGDGFLIMHQSAIGITPHAATRYGQTQRIFLVISEIFFRSVIDVLEFDSKCEIVGLDQLLVALENEIARRSVSCIFSTIRFGARGLG